MVMVAIGTLNGLALELLAKKQDIFVGMLVAVITILLHI
jgi:hypothetical protein